MNQQSMCVKIGIFIYYVVIIEGGINKIVVIYVIQFIVQLVMFGFFYFVVFNRIWMSEVIIIVGFYDIFVIIRVGVVVSIIDFLFGGE